MLASIPGRVVQLDQLLENGRPEAVLRRRGAEHRPAGRPGTAPGRRTGPGAAVDDPTRASGATRCLGTPEGPTSTSGLQSALRGHVRFRGGCWPAGGRTGGGPRGDLPHAIRRRRWRVRRRPRQLPAQTPTRVRVHDLDPVSVRPRWLPLPPNVVTDARGLCRQGPGGYRPIRRSRVVRNRACSICPRLPNFDVRRLQLIASGRGGAVRRAPWSPYARETDEGRAVSFPVAGAPRWGTGVFQGDRGAGAPDVCRAATNCTGAARPWASCSIATTPWH